ncbi:DnaJ family domain-containing protein [Virgibacillus necropolis]|uniref:Enterochelin esterase n=1 Tax=Virgibacillus necropolis TaxID=163877 RepID=A0A221MGL6_9BACI|nr:DUF1992 domain-containing protein [Virgibacillus necropolis]ASN06770.1 enterochelin esterase [Virgibacillus necropolis]
MGEDKKPKEDRDQENADIEYKEEYTDYMTEIIRKAEREGHFDDLPGKGKPLKLEKNYYNPADKQLYRTLADNHILPRWVQLGNEIDLLKEEIVHLDGKEKHKKIKEVNKKIKEYNYACPSFLQKNKMSES